MIYKYFSSLFNNLIVLIDHNNKKKIVKFFKKNLQDKSLIVIDVGAHKGETIDLFFNYVGSPITSGANTGFLETTVSNLDIWPIDPNNKPKNPAAAPAVYIRPFTGKIAFYP